MELFSIHITYISQFMNIFIFRFLTNNSLDGGQEKYYIYIIIFPLQQRNASDIFSFIFDFFMIFPDDANSDPSSRFIN